MTSNKLAIVTLAVVFNLCFEYAVGGVNRIFERPLTIVWLFFIYFTLFSMLDDLIRRFRIDNIQVAVFAICFGILPELYLTGSIFTEPLILGINWWSFLTINVVWWGVLQSLVTLYFANRIVHRKWDEPTMGRLGWGLCIAYMAFLCIVSVSTSETLRRGPFVGYAVGTAVQLCGMGFLVLGIRRRGPRPTYTFKPHPMLDFAAFGTIAVFVAIGTVVAGMDATAQEGNMLDDDALRLTTIWTFVVFVSALGYYALERRPITT